MGIRGSLSAVVVALVLATAVHAVEPDEVLPDPALEARARTLSLELRCLVCQNQSIDDSNAPLARDLRLLVRERLKAGDSDGDVRDYVVQRYGDFVLLRPPVNASTLALWLAPILILGCASLLIWRRVNKDQTVPPQAGLSELEEAELERILKRPDA